MRTILVSALLLLSAAFLVCRLLKKKEPRIYLIYQVGIVIIAFAALLTDDVLLTCCIAAICVRFLPSPSARHLVERLEKGFIQGESEHLGGLLNCN